MVDLVNEQLLWGVNIAKVLSKAVTGKKLQGGGFKLRKILF